MEQEMKKVFSGETELISAEQFSAKWYPDFDEKRVEWEDLLKSQSLQEFLKNMKVIPLYQYIQNYLYFWFYKKNPAGEITQEELDDLVQKTRAAFKGNHMPSAKCKEDYVREILTTEWSRTWDSFDKASAERIFELALGLNLPLEDVEALLQKAVKRAGFNYYDEEELLTYCVIRYQPTDRYRCLKALKRDFSHISQIEDKNMNKVYENTLEVRDDLEDIMDGEIYKDNVYVTGNLNEALRFFLARYKGDTIAGRTAAIVFDDLYQEILEEYETEILAFKKVYRQAEEIAKTTLQVTFDPAKKNVIPKDTIFWAERNTRDYGKVVVEFASKEAVPFPAWISVKIPVKSCQEQVIEKEKKETPCYIRKEERLTLKNSDDAALIKEILTDTKVTFQGKEGEKAYAEGMLAALAVPGLVIPKGTKFCYGDFEYQSTEEVTAAPVFEVEVECTTPHKEGEQVAGTGTIKYMKAEIDGILQVTNPKPVKMRQATDKISKEVFREFLYGHNIEDLKVARNDKVNCLIGRWFTETELTSVRFTKIQQQIKARKNSEAQKNEVRRSDIITLFFLCFCKEIAFEKFNGSQEDLERIYKDFVSEVDEELEKCRMMPFYLTNPYERLLAYLLKTDTPVDSLRNMWTVVNAGRRNIDV